MRKRNLLAGIAVLPLAIAGLTGASKAPHAKAGSGPGGSDWTPVYQSNFAADGAAPKGSFAGCTDPGVTGTHLCPNLPSVYESQLWAYPTGWPDTATQRGITPGGVYHPEDTLWIGGGNLVINMYQTGGVNYVGAVVPKASINKLYGKYTERVRVTAAPTGYKSAHLLWPNAGDANPNSGAEIDFPEGDWDDANGNAFAYYHPGDGGSDQLSGDSGVQWSAWHTYTIKWMPGEVDTYVDNNLILKTTDPRFVPTENMDWIIQNESSLDGESAVPGPHAQMEISYIEYDKYTP